MRDPYTGEHIRPEPSRRRRPRAAAFIVALAVLAGAFLVGQAITKPAADPSALSVVEECQQALGYPARTNADKTWLKTCIHALTPPTVSPSGTPTAPPPTASPTPTVSPTDTPSPTTTSPVPTTTPPTTTPPPSPTPTSSGCPVAGKNVPGAADPWGGCWPGPGNTGVPAGTVLTDYTGPCTITAPNTVIDAKTVSCDLSIQATGVVIRNSVVHGMIDGGEGTGSSFLLQDSLVDNPADDNCLCVGSDNFVVVRSEIRGAYREIYCRRNCDVADTWVHGQQLIASLGQHASGIRQEQGSTVTHSTLSCDWPEPNDNTTLGCSADLGGYPDFAPVNHNTYTRNLFIAASRDPNDPNPPGGPGATTGFCAYGGATAGKPFSSDPTNATYQVFVENVWQRGITGKCGDYGPITDFATNRTGNQWVGNTFDDGTAVSPA